MASLSWTLILDTRDDAGAISRIRAQYARQNLSIVESCKEGMLFTTLALTHSRKGNMRKRESVGLGTYAREIWFMILMYTSFFALRHLSLFKMPPQCQKIQASENL